MISRKRCLSTVVLLAAAVSVAAQSQGPERRFVGKWNAQFKGKTFTTLELEAKDNKLTGSLAGANINMDKDGNLTSAEKAATESEVIGAKLSGGVLSFTTKDQDSGETMRWKMWLTKDREGELLLEIPGRHIGIPTPRPWKIRREITHP